MENYLKYLQSRAFSIYCTAGFKRERKIHILSVKASLISTFIYRKLMYVTIFWQKKSFCVSFFFFPSLFISFIHSLHINMKAIGIIFLMFIKANVLFIEDIFTNWVKVRNTNPPPTHEDGEFSVWIWSRS